jgi:hypothetical protein
VTKADRAERTAHHRLQAAEVPHVGKDPD